ncbi:MAG: D-glycero-beta-D-manno-heptose 1-phosphate adenylyltransferase [Deltaproteobacteria bacterium]|nr:D-glycero-beta-D-manno-heptose 1-phosphate adenylyltransferase [Deltaproteobacteria bacterium]
MSKIVEREKLKKIRRTLKGTVVFTNGCFDILHVGHIQYLKQARKLGSYLVVALNTDKSVRKIKGKNRPIVPQNERAEVLAALECVDFVTFFDEDTPLKTLKLLQPHIIVKGGDWAKENIVGKDVVEKYGGQAISLNFVEGKSTSHIIDKILKTSIPSSRT